MAVSDDSPLPLAQKVCTKCFEAKPVTAFNPRGDQPGKLRSHCKACAAQRSQAYAASHREALRQAARAYYLAHKPHIIAQTSAYQAAHPERRRQAQRRQYQRHAEARRQARRNRYWRDPEQARATRRAYARANRAKELESRRRYTAGNQERLYEYRRRYAASHREQLRQKHRRYRLGHLAKFAEDQARRRALKRANPTGRVDYEALWQRDGGICYLCNTAVERAQAEFDHVIPVSRGGSHTAGNLRVTHRTCNRRKHTKLVESL